MRRIIVQLLIVYCISLLSIPFTYASDCDYSEDPEMCHSFYDSPTADSLEAVPDPTPEDFAYLISENRDGAIEYLMVNYRTDFAKQLVSTSDFRDKDERAIAQQYYAEDDQHINDDSDGFTEFLQREGVEIKGINGPVKGYTTSGVLTGANQQINVNDFKKSPLKDKYALEVTSSGDIVIIPKTAQGEPEYSVHFTGSLQGDSSGKFNLASGTIEDIPVKYGYKLEFDEKGNIIGGTVNEFNGITFSGPTPIKVSFDRYVGTDEHVIVIEVHDATVVSVADNPNLPDIEMTGSASFPLSGEGIDKQIYIPAGQTLVVNGYQITSSSSISTEVKLGDPAWYESYLGSATDTLRGVFGFPIKEAPSAQIGEESLTLEGEGVVIDFNVEAFVAGEEQPEPPTSTVDISILESSSHVYKKGDTGNEVAVIQQMLMEQIDPQTGQPYLATTYTTKSGEVVASNDGVFGVLTDAALRAWQTDNSLVVDGKFGKNSRARAYDLYSSNRYMTATVTTGVAGRAVITKEESTLVLNGQEIRMDVGSDAMVMEDGETYVQPTDKPQETPDVAVEVVSRAEDGSGSEETSLVGAVVDTGVYVARRVVGEVASVGVAGLDQALTLTGAKKESPHSVEFFQHYIENDGKELVLEQDEIPREWQEWVVGYARSHHGSQSVSLTLGPQEQCLGTCYASVSPYDVGLYDLQNSFGHFDLQVVSNHDGSTTYTLLDTYVFAEGEEDTSGRSRHGFGLSTLDQSEVNAINGILPSTEFEHPSGNYKERFQVQNLGGKTYLLIPQQFLATVGKEYPIRASFTVPAPQSVAQGTTEGKTET